MHMQSYIVPRRPRIEHPKLLLHLGEILSIAVLVLSLLWLLPGAATALSLGDDANCVSSNALRPSVALSIPAATLVPRSSRCHSCSGLRVRSGVLEASKANQHGRC